MGEYNIPFKLQTASTNFQKITEPSVDAMEAGRTNLEPWIIIVVVGGDEEVCDVGEVDALNLSEPVKLRTLFSCQEIERQWFHWFCISIYGFWGF